MKIMYAKEAASLALAILVAGATHAEPLRVDDIRINITIVDAQGQPSVTQDRIPASPGLAEPDAPAAPEALDVLDLGARGRLHGRLLAIDAEEDLLLWEYPSAKASLDFSLKSKRGVTLGARPQEGSEPSPSTLWFANNDIIHGRMSEITQDKILFDTWYAGTLEIPRNMVRRLAPGVVSRTVFYDGPDEAANWNQGSGDGGWRYEGGVLRALGGDPLGRSFEGLPGMCYFYFDIAWTGYLNFFFSFYAEDENVYNRNSYALRFDGNSVQPHYFDEDGQSRAIGDRARSNFLAPAPEGRRARISLYVNKETGEITVDVNGAPLGVWTDANRPAPAGEAIVIQQLMRGLSFHDLRIEHWSGVVPREADPGAESRTDVLSMTNNDKVSGRLISAKDEVILFETPFATMEVPASRVRIIQLNTTELQSPSSGDHPVRAYFTSYGHLTFDLLRIDDDQVEGQSDAVGSFVMPLSALRRLQFNPPRNNE